MSRVPSRQEFLRPKRTRKPAIGEWLESQPKTCPICCDHYASEVHHIIRKGMGGNPKAECPENWIYICILCHRNFHAQHIPLAAVLRAKKDIGGYDRERLCEIAGYRLPELVG